MKTNLNNTWRGNEENNLLDNTPERIEIIERIKYICRKGFEGPISLSVEQINDILLHLESNNILDDDELRAIILQKIDYGYIDDSFKNKPLKVEDTTKTVQTNVANLILPGKGNGKHTYL